MEGRPGQERSISSFGLVLHDPWSIYHIQERFLLRYRLLAASAVFVFLALPPRAVAIRSRVLDVQDVINLSCWHPHHASSLTVASDPSPLAVRTVGTVTIFTVAPRLASSSSRTFLPSSRLFHLPGRRAVLQGWRHVLHPSSTIETRTGLRLESTVDMRTGLLWHCRHQSLLAVARHVLVSNNNLLAVGGTFLYPVKLSRYSARCNSNPYSRPSMRYDCNWPPFTRHSSRRGLPFQAESNVSQFMGCCSDEVR